MKTFIVLLRAVNVGGTGKLPMADLKRLCETAGFAQVRTYIASGNVVLNSATNAAQVKSSLETALAVYAGKPVGVMVRTASEMAAVLASNPFPDAAPNRMVVTFLDAAPPVDTLDRLSHRGDEEIVLGKREIYVHYGAGMASSKLVVPAAKLGTGRNLNTITRLVRMANADHAGEP